MIRRKFKIINLSQRFSLGDEIKQDESKVIIISVNNTLIGLGVNKVNEIIRINSNNISTAPEITKGVKKDYIEGIARLKDKLLILLDIENIFSQKEINKLQNMESN